MSEDFEQLENSDESLLSESVDFNFDDIVGNENFETSALDNEGELKASYALDDLFASDDELNDIVSDVEVLETTENIDVENEPTNEISEDKQENCEDEKDEQEVLKTETQNTENEAISAGDAMASNDPAQTEQDDLRIGFLRWYDGESSEAQFEVSKDSESTVLKGTDDCRVVHINIGFDAYGWLIRFDNGIIMSVSDVREYQLRNGMLPDTSGTITYASAQIEFRDIEKIKIYESVRYFTYA